jgi:serine/threonine protein phosphatase PrpC
MFGASIFLNNSNKPNSNKEHPMNINQMNQFFSVSEYFYKEDQNAKYRNTMEDYSKIIDKFMNDSNKGFFSLYDGHGGSDPVKYCKERMPELLTKALIENPKDIEKAITTTFQNIDYELTFTDSENIGTTAVICYIYKDEKGNKILVCANVGDSRCILLSKNNYKRLSYDHKCTDVAEAERIKSTGGIIFSNRVFGQLVLSRALGDHALKKYGVIATPHITKTNVYDGDYVIMGSDGIWDVVNEEDTLKYSKDHSSAEELSKYLVKTAMLQGSKDNISCLVIKV